MFHVKHSDQDTITAVITPQGRGGVGIIRISGSRSREILRKLLKTPANKDFASHRVYHGWISEERNIDEVIAYYMKAPHSYTGEDVVELCCHASPVIMDKVISKIIGLGARLANRGEFTKRAFINGRIDLIQAEAVVDVISANNKTHASKAIENLSGKLSKNIGEIKGRLMGVSAQIEANIDFPDDISEMNRGEALRELMSEASDIKKILSTAAEGRAIREGIRVAIIGRPNVGKSSIMNAILKSERVIVTDEAGTTRDTIEEIVNLGEIGFVICDTAGLRKPKAKAEKAGIERTKKEMAAADIIIMVLDGTKKLSEGEKKIIKKSNNDCTVVVVNKTDKKRVINLREIGGPSSVIMTAAIEGRGIEALEKKLKEIAKKGLPADDNEFIINKRQEECLTKADKEIADAMSAIKKGMPFDVVGMGIKSAIYSLDQMTGVAADEEIINSIFERFCVGK